MPIISIMPMAMMVPCPILTTDSEVRERTAIVSYFFSASS